MRLTEEQLEQRAQRETVIAQYKKQYDDLEQELRVSVVITFSTVPEGVQITARSEKYDITFTRTVKENEQLEMNYLTSMHCAMINDIIEEYLPLKSIMNKEDNAIQLNKDTTPHIDPRQAAMYGSRR